MPDYTPQQQQALDNIKVGPLAANLGGADLTKDLSEQNHLAGQNYYDQGVQGPGGLIDRQANRSAGNSDFFKDTLSHGLNPGDNNQLGAIGGDQSDPMAKALSSRYQQKYETNLGGVKAQNDVNAKVQNSANESQVSSELQSVYSTDEQNYAQQYQFQVNRQKLNNDYVNAQNAANAQLYGQIFSGIGAVGGTIAGGPAGGAAGSKLGSAAGNAAGGG